MTSPRLAAAERLRSLARAALYNTRAAVASNSTELFAGLARFAREAMAIADDLENRPGLLLPQQLASARSSAEASAALAEHGAPSLPAQAWAQAVVILEALVRAEAREQSRGKSPREGFSGAEAPVVAWSMRMPARRLLS